MKKNKVNPFSHKHALILSIVISLLLNFIMILGFFYGKSKNFADGIDFFDVIGTPTLFQFICNISLFYLLYEFNFWGIKRPKNKILICLAGSITIIAVMSPLFAQLQMYLFPERGIPFSVYMAINLIKDLIVLIIVFLSTLLIYNMVQKQKIQLENERLNVENIRNRYEVLKSQVDPHFLFNSLNTLNGLIGYDDEKAHEYVDKLSSVYRYTIQNKEVITLKEELEFTMAYVYLMKIRYNESLHLEYNIDARYMNYYIIPFGVQILIENSIKHNIISNKYPLRVFIETTENNVLIVKNQIRKKESTGTSGKIGLPNLSERYKLLFYKDIIVSENNGIFQVEVPLIEPKKSKINRSMS